ncbi:MAG: polysaccharide biosynthesis C-terminal domain-containing protein [Saprospiraceae bacterium]|nr:polysaccharide biosynthesis C-terminal domain-containing protein [Saprospiraceae bacterium]
MGIVRRQSIKKTIVSFIGVLVGTVSVLKIYPLEFEIYGRAQFIIATAGLIIPFATLGISRLTVRYFPDFEDDNSSHHGFLGFLLLFTTSSFLVFVLFLSIFESSFLAALEHLGIKSDNFLENRNVILIISLVLVFNSILAMHASNFKRVVVPEIFNNLFVKLGLPVLVLLYYLRYIGVLEFNYLYALVYILAMFGLIGYLMYLKQFSLMVDLKYIRGTMFRDMIEYGLFNTLSSIGYLLSFRIDSVMIGSMLDLVSVGHYNFYSYIVNTVAVPFLALTSIAGPLIAQNFKKNDLDNAAKIYRQSSETLFIVGLGILGVVLISLESLLSITGKLDILWPFRYCFIFLGLGQLINVTTGVNEPIISYSKYYKFNLYAMAFLSVMNLILNYFLIPRLGILGAAIATATSLAAYNILKSVFIYQKFKILPLTKVHFKVLLISIGSFCIAALIPSIENRYLDIFVHSGVYALVFSLSMISFKISEDITELWLSIRKIFF